MKPGKSAKPGKRVKSRSRSKPAKPVRISGVVPSATPGVGAGGNVGAMSTGKQLAFISAFLFLIAAAISLYLAWRDIQGGTAPEMLF